MPLITKIEELKIYNASANVGIKIPSITPSLKHVERVYIIPELGQALYDIILDAYETALANPIGDPLNSDEAELVDHIRAALAPLAILHYKNSVIQSVSDGGANEKTTENSSLTRLWVNTLQSETLFTEGMKAIDLLLKYLEENKATWTEWTAGEGYTEFKEFLLQTTKEFNDEVAINDSRKFFRAMRPSIKYAELMILQDNISEEFYERLVTGRKDDDLTADEETALKKIFPVVANYAIAHSPLTIEHGNDGTYTIYSENEFSGKGNSKRAPLPADVRELKNKHERIASQYLDKLIKYLNTEASVTVFSEFYASDKYVSPATETPTDINETLNSGFAM